MRKTTISAGVPFVVGADADHAPPWEATPTGLRSEWRLDSVSRSVPAVRWWLRAFLGQAQGLSHEQIADVLSVACEATSNAVAHPQRPTEPFFDLCTDIDRGAVTIVVKDYGEWRPTAAPGGRGRGLFLMDALADTTVSVGPHGTTVTIKYPRSARGPGQGLPS